MHEDFLVILKNRLLELITLPIGEDKIKSIENLITRYTSELHEKIKNCNDKVTIEKEFNHYVRNILSIVETLIYGEQLIALKRLMKNEIYSCCSIIISDKNL